MVEGADGLGEADRVFLRHVVAGGRLPVAGEVREVARVLGAGPGRVQRVFGGVDHDRGDGDRWLGGDPPLILLVRGIAGCEPVPVPVGVDDRVNESWIVE
jgi:hypothetical protein